MPGVFRIKQGRRPGSDWITTQAEHLRIVDGPPTRRLNPSRAHRSASRVPGPSVPPDRPQRETPSCALL